MNFATKQKKTGALHDVAASLVVPLLHLFRHVLVRPHKHEN